MTNHDKAIPLCGVFRGKVIQYEQGKGTALVVTTAPGQQPQKSEIHFESSTYRPVVQREALYYFAPHTGEVPTVFSGAEICFHLQDDTATVWCMRREIVPTRS